MKAIEESYEIEDKHLKRLGKIIAIGTRIGHFASKNEFSKYING